MPNVFRSIPSVSELLESPRLKSLVDNVSRNVVVAGAREFLDNLRTDLQSAASEIKPPSATELADRIADWILDGRSPPLRPVINATGIILHTGLGRAPLAEEAIAAVDQCARDYCSLEVDLNSGERSQRGAAVDKALRRLTGAEASVVVNNNAAATMLALSAVAAGKEVVVSRGELVEIGGSFRLPDVMEMSGAVLREVGTTNKTRLSDYQQAIGPQTGALLRVHASNYAIVGFTERVGIAELAALGRRRQTPVIDDIGSGALVDFTGYGVSGEPIAAESIKAGADLVLFSGDKLLGGPQCGIIVGRRSLCDRIAQHPMARAMRVGKLTLAALAATLRLYDDPELAERSVPLLSLLSTPLENLRNRAERLAPQMAAAEGIEAAEAVEDVSFLGGGSMPTQQIPTWCVSLAPARGSVDELAMSLRTGEPAVFGRVRRQRLLLDLRSVPPANDCRLVEAVESIDGRHEASANQNDFEPDE